MMRDRPQKDRAPGWVRLAAFAAAIILSLVIWFVAFHFVAGWL